MFCPNCGTNLPDGSQFCNVCGRTLTSASPVAPNPYAPPANLQPTSPMAWYKFLIYFALFASAVLNALSGISMLTGAPYDGSADLVYAVFPDLKTVDMIYGLGVLFLAAFAIYTRFQLSGYKKNGPKCLIGVYVLNLVVSIYYLIGVSDALGELAEEALASTNSSTTAALVVSAVMAVVNYIYFKKRASLFVN